MNRSIGAMAVVSVMLLGAASAWADDAHDRSPLSATFGYVNETVQNFAGGLKRGSENLGSGVVAVTLDLERGVGWPGATLYAEFLVNHGRDPSAALIGDAQYASNIADRNRTRVHQFWIEQAFSTMGSLLIGRHDLNSEFQVTEYGGLFLNSSFGVTPELGGNSLLSIFPETGLAARLLLKPDEHVSLRVAAYDGDPTTRALRASEGYMYIAEAVYASDSAAYKVGVWRHTRSVNGAGLNGLYFIVDQHLVDVGSSALGAFVQYGITQPSAAIARSYVGGGLHLSEPLPGRIDDEAGIAFASVRFSHAYNAVLPGSKGHETSIELTYRAQVTDWLAVQPAFQYIIAPSADPAVHNASVGFLRFEVGM